MKTVWIGLALVIVLVTSAVHVYAQQGVGGTWTLDAYGMPMAMRLAQEGEKISGTIDTPHGVIPLKGDFSEGKLNLVGAATSEHPIEVTARATLGSDGSLTGTFSANSMEIAFTAVRDSSSADRIRRWHNYLLGHILGVSRESAFSK